MTAVSESCGQRLNDLYPSCHLPKMHDGFHECDTGNRGVWVQWWTPDAPARERRFFIPDHAKT